MLVEVSLYKRMMKKKDRKERKKETTREAYLAQ
jgi:hypothetical protein